MAVIKLKLEHEIAALRGMLEWDEATGAISGPLADHVAKLAAAAAASGSVIGPPHPTVYDVSSTPLRNRRDMAVILSGWWPLPEQLRDAMPKPDVDEEPDVEVVY